VTVPELVAWLARHLDWVCEHHPAVDELATEVRACLYVCRAVMGDTPPRPTMCEGVACPTCDMRALYRIPGSSLIHCGACPHLMTEEEYAAWTKELARELRG
jgi:hypothetical protein